MTKLSDRFKSTFHQVGELEFPDFSGTRVQMMPIILGDVWSVPETLAHYSEALKRLFALGGHTGEVGYLTIDEKVLQPGETHRRPGLHVDGIFQGRVGGSWGGGGGWASVATGMLTVSSAPGCRAFSQEFSGWPGMEGECDHLADQCEDGTVLSPGVVYWAGGLCVHESIPMTKETPRQLIRLSLPSDGPWFEGYTENPLGIKPRGEILPMRRFMVAG
jgi:hypothetical protein